MHKNGSICYKFISSSRGGLAGRYWRYFGTKVALNGYQGVEQRGYYALNEQIGDECLKKIIKTPDFIFSSLKDSLHLHTKQKQIWF